MSRDDEGRRKRPEHIFVSPAGCHELVRARLARITGDSSDVEMAALRDGDSIEVFIFNAWYRGVFRRAGAAPIVEIEADGNGVIMSPMALRAANPTIVRIRRRWDA